MTIGEDMTGVDNTVVVVVVEITVVDVTWEMLTARILVVIRVLAGGNWGVVVTVSPLARNRLALAFISFSSALFSVYFSSS